MNYLKNLLGLNKKSVESRKSSREALVEEYNNQMRETTDRLVESGYRQAEYYSEEIDDGIIRPFGRYLDDLITNGSGNLDEARLAELRNRYESIVFFGPVTGAEDGFLGVVQIDLLDQDDVKEKAKDIQRLGAKYTTHRVYLIDKA